MQSNITTSSLTKDKIIKLEKQQHRIVGNHSAVKICFWCKNSLRNKGVCYKSDFYGVPSHQCLEMSPAITCNKRCKHCWRDTSVYSSKWAGPVDNPKEIIEGCIKERIDLLNGFFGAGYDNKFIRESLIPKHAAISLIGEPMMYPRISDLVKEFFNKDFNTVFIVTSGTVPEAIKSLEFLPTNIYLSVEAYNEEMYKKLCLPVIQDAWDKFLDSAKILSKIPTRTVIKITCMKGINMAHPENFKEIIELMIPDIITCKSYAWMGCSKKRMKKENTPNFDEVFEFSKKLSNSLEGYEIASFKKGSDVVILRRTYPRIIGDESFIYENLEKEKLRNKEFADKIKYLFT